MFKFCVLPKISSPDVISLGRCSKLMYSLVKPELIKRRKAVKRSISKKQTRSKQAQPQQQNHRYRIRSYANGVIGTDTYHVIGKRAERRFHRISIKNLAKRLRIDPNYVVMLKYLSVKESNGLRSKQRRRHVMVEINRVFPAHDATCIIKTNAFLFIPNEFNFIYDGYTIHILNKQLYAHRDKLSKNFNFNENKIEIE